MVGEPTETAALSLREFRDSELTAVEWSLPRNELGPLNAADSCVTWSVLRPLEVGPGSIPVL